MWDTLDRDDRLRLMGFLCSFAWADLHVADSERELVEYMIKKLALTDEEQAQVQRWLEVPPAAHEVDPAEIPREHRELFLDTARAVVLASGTIREGEAESLVLLEQLLRG